jgi:hypothetical protein
MIPSGIEPATLRLVAQCLKYLPWRTEVFRTSSNGDIGFFLGALILKGRSGYTLVQCVGRFSDGEGRLRVFPNKTTHTPARPVIQWPPVEFIGDQIMSLLWPPWDRYPQGYSKDSFYEKDTHRRNYLAHRNGINLVLNVFTR